MTWPDHRAGAPLRSAALRLVEAIETQIERSVRDSGVPFDWHLARHRRACNRLPQTVSLAIFRIAQEAINKPSDTPTATGWTCISPRCASLVLEIRDNGVGMKQKSAPAAAHRKHAHAGALIAAQFSCGRTPTVLCAGEVAAPGEGERT